MVKVELDTQSKDKVLAIMQPTYFPWIGYFSMINLVDEFVFLDDVQLVKRSWQVRNRIKTPNGEIFLSIPIRKTSNRDELKIKDAIINYDEKWVKKHLGSIQHNYSKAKYYNEVYPFVENLIDSKIEHLSHFNKNIVEQICKKIGIQTKILNSSELSLKKLNKDEKLLNICEELDCNTYYSAKGSSDYIRRELFEEKKINLIYQEYEHPVYEQMNGDFISHLAIIDLLFNVGFEKSLDKIVEKR